MFYWGRIYLIAANMNTKHNHPIASFAPLRTWLLLILIVFLSALACNFPGMVPSTSNSLTMQDLEETAAASGYIQTATSPVLPTSTSALFTPPISDAPPTAAPIPAPGDFFTYITQPGDTPNALAARFEVGLEQIPLPANQETSQHLEPGQTLRLPNGLSNLTPPELLLPDGELVYSPSTVNFDLVAFIQDAGGALSTYQETVDGQNLNGVQIVQRVTQELSVNPRLLLAILEYRSGGVYGQTKDGSTLSGNPLGFYVPERHGLYQELMIAGTQLNVAYYGWRSGSFLSIKYSNGTSARLNPVLNPTTAALQHLFAMFYRAPDWQAALYGENSLPALHSKMFGNPWQRSSEIGFLFPPGLELPLLELPFAPGERWSLTAGPHPSWNAGTPRGALDFSPVTGEPVCAISQAWVTASASGNIIRARENIVVLDLDGDGFEQTGWVILYYHLAESGLVKEGIQVEVDTPLGHPSCEGGRATGKHVHIARKYNGEWVAADGPLPFLLSGWRAIADQRNYYGYLTKGNQEVTADPSGTQTSIIVRD
jgi:LasA protease